MYLPEGKISTENITASFDFLYFLKSLYYNQPKKVKDKEELKRKNTIFSNAYYQAFLKFWN